VHETAALCTKLLLRVRNCYSVYVEGKAQRNETATQCTKLLLCVRNCCSVYETATPCTELLLCVQRGEGTTRRNCCSHKILDLFSIFLSLRVYLRLAETSQQPISQPTWLKVTPTVSIVTIVYETATLCTQRGNHNETKLLL